MIIERNHLFSDVVNKLEFVISDSGYVQGDQKWRDDDARSPFTRLYYFDSGDAIVCDDYEEIALQPGYIYLIPSGHHISYRCDSCYTKIFFHVNLNAPNGYDVLADCARILRVQAEKEELQQIISCYQSEQPRDLLRLQQMVYRRLIAMLPREVLTSFSATSYSPLIRGIMDYIQLTMRASVTVKELAERFYVSESVLTRRFKKEVGMSIGEYVNDIIFTNAEKMLLKPDWSIGEISRNLGFCDQFYFSRRFKQRYHCTPYEYRTKNQCYPFQERDI